MTRRVLFILLVVCAMSKHTHQQFNQQFNPQLQPGQQQLPGQQQQQQNQFNSQFQSQQGVAGAGALQQTIYQFLKTLPQASKFVQSMDLIAQQLQDRSVLSVLNGEQSLQTLYPGTPASTGVTVFVPINDAFNNMPSDAKSLKVQLYNFVVQDRLNLDRLRDLSGSNLTSTFGVMPRLFVRVVKNFYKRQLNPAVSPSQQPQQQYQQPMPGQQPVQQQPFPQQSGNMPFPQGVQPQQPFQQNGGVNQQVPFANQPFNNPSQQWNQQPQGSSAYLNNSNIYNQMSYMYQNGGQNGQNTYNGPPISLEFPQDELFLLNDAILLEKYEVANGIIYLMSSNPRYYDQTAWNLLTTGAVNGLSQNTNFWVTQATQAKRQGSDNLYLSFRIADQSTYFLPSDAGFQKYLDRDRLQNATFLYEVIFKSHRVSGQVLFDYYLDSPNVYYTDTLLPVSTVHRRLAGSNVDDIEISIGHVKGKINPDLRNIYCASGIIHVVDTVLGVPQMSAYQKMMLLPELSTFRQLVDRSSRYRQLLDQSPTQIQYPTQPPNMYRQAQIRSQRNKAKRQQQNVNPFNQQQQLPYQQQQQYGNGGYGASDVRFMTILAPNEAGLLAVRDFLMQNDTALDQFLSSHIIVDNEQNRVFYTDLDQNTFQNGQRYSTLNPTVFLTATIQRLETDSRNRVALQIQGQNGIQSRIVDGDERVTNGVIQIIDRPLMQFSTPDLMSVLDKYATTSGTGASATTAAINNFYDLLKATGIYNELKSSQYKQFTLFIPTNAALQRYMSIVNSNDMTQRRQMVQSHISVGGNESAMATTNGTIQAGVQEANENLFDINRQFKLENNEVIRIEVPYDGELKDHYIVYKNEMVKILGELYASNGRIFIIDSILTKDGHLARIAGIHDTNTPFSHAYEVNTSNRPTVAHSISSIFCTIFAIFLLYSI